MGLRLREKRNKIESEFYFNIPDDFESRKSKNLFIFYVNRYSSREAYKAGEIKIGESVMITGKYMPDLNSKSGNVNKIFKKYGYEILELPIYSYTYKNENGIYEYDENDKLIVETKTNINRFRTSIKVLEDGQ